MAEWLHPGVWLQACQALTSLAILLLELDLYKS